MDSEVRPNTQAELNQQLSWKALGLWLFNESSMTLKRRCPRSRGYVWGVKVTRKISLEWSGRCVKVRMQRPLWVISCTRYGDVYEVSEALGQTGPFAPTPVVWRWAGSPSPLNWCSCSVTYTQNHFIDCLSLLHFILASKAASQSPIYALMAQQGNDFDVNSWQCMDSRRESPWWAGNLSSRMPRRRGSAPVSSASEPGPGSRARARLRGPATPRPESRRTPHAGPAGRKRYYLERYYSIDIKTCTKSNQSMSVF